MKPDPMFHRVREMTAEEKKEKKRKYKKDGTRRKRSKRGRRKDVVIYEGGATGLRQQRRSR